MALGMLTGTHLGMLAHTHLWSAAMALGMLRAWECIRPRQLSPRASCRLSPRLRSCSTTCIPRASCMVTRRVGTAAHHQQGNKASLYPMHVFWYLHACRASWYHVTPLRTHACMCTQWPGCDPVGNKHQRGVGFQHEERLQGIRGGRGSGLNHSYYYLLSYNGGVGTS